MMALVAYGSSGESDSESEAELELKDAILTTSGPGPIKTTALHKEELEELWTEEKDSSNKEETNSFDISDEEEDAPIRQKENVMNRKRGIFQFLPKPQNSKKIVTGLGVERDIGKDVQISEKEVKNENLLGESTSNDQDEKLKESSNGDISTGSKNTEDSMSKALNNLPKPKYGKDTEGKKGKSTIKITLPALMDIDSDSDEDDVKQETKKVKKPGQSGSGLMGLLPKPRQSISFASKSNPFESERKRTLIPYTLTKKKDEKLEKKSEPQKSVIDQHRSEDEDSDADEPANFFSLGTGNTTASTTFLTSQPKTISVEARKDPKDHFEVEQKIATNSMVNTETKSRLSGKDENRVDMNTRKISDSVGSGSYPQTSVIRQSKPKMTMNKVSDINTRVCTSQSSVSVTGPYDSTVTGPYDSPSLGSYNPGTYDNDVVGPYLPDTSNTWSDTADTRSGYAQLPYQQQAYAYSDVPNMEMSHTDAPLDNAALFKLQGKRKIPKEALSIIDVRGDEIQGNARNLLKQLTEETAHQPKKSKAEMPKALERRKHQITYLAFQAKEREMELKNTWSANSQTRRQTQSKYGF